jgi:hypothetical protein
LVDFNPVAAAHRIGGNDADTHAYSLEEVHDLMSAIHHHTAQAAFMIAAIST